MPTKIRADKTKSSDDQLKKLSMDSEVGTDLLGGKSEFEAADNPWKGISQPRTGVITKNGVGVHANPSGGHYLRPDLAAGTLVNVTEEQGGWLKCTFYTAQGQRTGWVDRHFVKATKLTPAKDEGDLKGGPPSGRGNARLADYEYIAHFVVYLPAGSSLEEKETEIVANAGYDPKSIQWYTGGGGFQAVTLKALPESGVNHIVGVQGTTGDFRTWYSDANPEAVGLNQYKDNKAKIIKMLASLPGKVDITGHSLGGAVAQIITAKHPGEVANLITFQSPGIKQEMVDEFNKAEDKPHVEHHIVVGDVVDKSGEANLPGSVYEHDFGIEQYMPRDLQNVLSYYLLHMAMSLGKVEKDLEKLVALQEEIRDIEANVITKAYNTGRYIAALTELVDHATEFYDYTSAFVDYGKAVGEEVGDAHTRHITLSQPYAAQQEKLGLTKDYVEAKPDEGSKQGGLGKGPDKEDPAAKSVWRGSESTTATEEYPHSGQRVYGEEVRDLVGTFLFKYFSNNEIEMLNYRMGKIGEAKDFAIDEIKSLDIQGFLWGVTKATFHVGLLIGQFGDEVGGMANELREVYKKYR